MILGRPLTFLQYDQISVLDVAILEECCMSSPDMQWLFYSGEWIVAQGPLVCIVTYLVSTVGNHFSEAVPMGTQDIFWYKNNKKNIPDYYHQGIQLILACSWARPAILVAGKGRGEMFLFLLFLHFHSCSSSFLVPLFHLFYCLFCFFSPFLWETTQNDPQGLTCC